MNVYEKRELERKWIDTIFNDDVYKYLYRENDGPFTQKRKGNGYVELKCTHVGRSKLQKGDVIISTRLLCGVAITGLGIVVDGKVKSRVKWKPLFKSPSLAQQDDPVEETSHMCNLARIYSYCIKNESVRKVIENEC